MWLGLTQADGSPAVSDSTRLYSISYLFSISLFDNTVRRTGHSAKFYTNIRSLPCLSFSLCHVTSISGEGNMPTSNAFCNGVHTRALLRTHYWPSWENIGERLWRNLKGLLPRGWQQSIGGGLRIRTLGGDKPSTVFKTAAFDHSASPPEIFFSTIQCLRKKRTRLYIDENGTQGAQATCVLVALKSFRT